jgi:hypothetical protein
MRGNDLNAHLVGDGLAEVIADRAVKNPAQLIVVAQEISAVEIAELGDLCATSKLVIVLISRLPRWSAGTSVPCLNSVEAGWTLTSSPTPA